MSPRETPVKPEENAHSLACAALGAAVGAKNAPIEPDLARVIEVWNTLDCDAREAVLAIIHAMKRG
jgi:hypothetical protein